MHAELVTKIADAFFGDPVLCLQQLARICIHAAALQKGTVVACSFSLFHGVHVPMLALLHLTHYLFL
jgi:hypothetical protein